MTSQHADGDGTRKQHIGGVFRMENARETRERPLLACNAKLKAFKEI